MVRVRFLDKLAIPAINLFRDSPKIIGHPVQSSSGLIALHSPDEQNHKKLEQFLITHQAAKNIKIKKLEHEILSSLGSDHNLTTSLTYRISTSHLDKLGLLDESLKRQALFITLILDPEKEKINAGIKDRTVSRVSFAFLNRETTNFGDPTQLSELKPGGIKPEALTILVEALKNTEAHHKHSLAFPKTYS